MFHRDTCCLLLISIHAPTRGATRTISTGHRLFSISIHAPTRGATEPDMTVYKLADISIHAPTRGATTDNNGTYTECFISIHAPTRGATWLYHGTIKADNNFNPRSHEGSDSNFRQKVLFSLSKNCLKYLILTTNYFK